METLKRILVFYAIFTCSNIEFTAQQCGLCARVGQVTDCSSLGWRYMKNIPFWCKSSTSVLLLNDNHFTYVPRFPGYSWRSLSKVYLLNNPIDCSRECKIGIPGHIITHCQCDIRIGEQDKETTTPGEEFADADKVQQPVAPTNGPDYSPSPKQNDRMWGKLKQDAMSLFVRSKLPTIII